MELAVLKKKMVDIINKYKYALLIVLIGLILIMLPQKREANINTTTATQVSTEQTTFEESLANILSKIHGAGNVEVMLTVLEGEEVIYQEDKNITNNGDNSGNRIDTVIVSDASRAENGLIRQVNPPVYRGAIIVCQGADTPSVKLAVTEAVSRITGIRANCISVLKMN